MNIEHIRRHFEIDEQDVWMYVYWEFHPTYIATLPGGLIFRAFTQPENNSDRYQELRDNLEAKSPSWSNQFNVSHGRNNELLLFGGVDFKYLKRVLAIEELEFDKETKSFSNIHHSEALSEIELELVLHNLYRMLQDNDRSFDVVQEVDRVRVIPGFLNFLGAGLSDHIKKVARFSGGGLK